MRRLGVGDFGNVAQASFVEMSEEWREELHPRFLFQSLGVAMHSNPRLDKRSNQPGPDRTLMIRAIALRHAAFVMRLEIRLTWRERPQAERRQQLCFDQRDNLFRTSVVLPDDFTVREHPNERKQS